MSPRFNKVNIMNNETELLETILSTEVLILAKQIEAEKRAKGAWYSDHYIGDAINLISSQRSSIVQRLIDRQLLSSQTTAE